MPATRSRRTRITWLVIAAAAFTLLVLGACGTNELVDHGGGANQPDAASGGTCSAGQQGCACDSEGASAACGNIDQKFGSYVTCMEGFSTCTNGTWGVCQGNTIIAQSLGGATIGANGIQPLGLTGPCTANPCDPSCIQTQEGPGDVPDGAPVLVTDAGVTIPPTVTVAGGGGDGGVCQGLQCQVNWACGKASPTTLTGHVYDPAGNNPLYNAYVYVPVDPNPSNLPAFPQGAQCDTCAGAGQLNAVAVAQTDPTGAFTLANVPTQSKAPGAQIPLVIQMGKWRRVTLLPAFPDCQSTAVAPANSRLPQNQYDGYNNHADLPQVAFVSGSADPFECMLLKAGISPSEFGSSSLNANRRFHYYNSPDSSGSSIDPGYGNVVTGDKMWNNNNGSWNLSAYDVVILACEGGEYDVTDRTTNGYTNLVNYTAEGGRVFMSHFSYVWMKYNTPWQGLVSTWGPTASVDTQDPLNASIITNGFPKGLAFQTWLGNTPNPNALTSGVLQIHQARQDFTIPLASGVQPWMTAIDTVGGSFGAGTCSSANCSSGSTCNTGACVGATQGYCGCYESSDCTAMGAGSTCTGYTLGHCSTSTCYQASECLNGLACSGHTGTCKIGGAVCETNATCTGTGNSCLSATKGTCSCGETADCPSGAGSCTARTAGVCGVATCSASSNCSTGNKKCNSAVLGECTCNSSLDCSFGATCEPTFNPAFSFNTPLTAAAANQCGRAVFTDFHVSTAAKDSAGAACTTSATCGYGSVCGGVNGVVGTCTPQTCDPDVNTGTSCGDSNFTCTGGTAANCGCYQTSDCTAMSAGTCSGGTLGTCSVATCTTNSQCSEGTCQNPTKGTCGCYESSDCTTMGAGSTCTGYTLGHCSTSTCYQASECLNGLACSGHTGACKIGGAVCETNATCTGTGNSCVGATKGTCGCGETADCPSGAGSCTGRTAGTCGVATCLAASGCSTGPKTCTGVVNGSCACESNSQCSSGGTCSGQSVGSCSSATCYANSDCTAGNTTCGGTTANGACQAQACTTSAQCDGTEQCINGTCNGCYQNADCPGSTSFCVGGAYSGVCGGTGNFPYECAQALLDPQEAALEFLFFDLSACVTPDNNPPPGPPVPVITYNPVTFTEDFVSTCPMGTVVKWRELDWQATVPNSASIVFAAQTANPAADGGIPNYTLVQSVTLATATTTTPNLPTGWNAALIDTSGISGTGGTGAFNLATPPVTSLPDLRVTFTLNPTTDMSQAPTLIQWEVKSDCVASE